jgi:hypothetical protein
MTCLEKISKANRWRIRTGQFASDETAGFNGHFLVPLEGHLWQVILSDGLGFRHLSATNAQKKILPPWTVLVRLKESFFADDEWAVIYLPAKDDYVNVHPYVHHIWAPLDEPLPKPLIALV